MDSDSWTTRLSAASRRYHSRSDLYYGGDDIDGDEESRPEFMCPFCADDFDVVGLCCHIDEEHAVEANNGNHIGSTFQGSFFLHIANWSLGVDHNVGEVESLELFASTPQILDKENLSGTLSKASEITMFNRNSQ
ncbi:drought-responsive family protein [Actinidia rufa]|uniref:Drought-responsive family protein n=1 Tax=Actinidia rufa TaxID=165716 RepID=A0A7J0GKX4_9ERIC|nr:drought-responsive family protein [Actinidia rufa]